MKEIHLTFSNKESFENEEIKEKKVFKLFRQYHRLCLENKKKQFN